MLPERAPMDVHMDECERHALEALGNRQFLRFGFYATQWRLLNRVSGDRRADPFRDLADQARELNKPFGGA